LNFIARLGGRDVFGRENLIAIVKVPRVLPRVIRLPDALCGGGRQGFVLLTSVIRAHLGELFPGRTVESFSQFRVTRDSDLDVDEDDVANLRQALRTGLSTRHYRPGAAPGSRGQLPERSVRLSARTIRPARARPCTRSTGR
jgi:polyphosphate kinase